jgi:hypothetical protein
VSRSVATEPIDIRAARRLAAPHAPRREHDLRRRRRPASRAWRHGASPIAGRALDVPVPLPRVIEHAPGDGYYHPASRAEVLEALRQMPPRYLYKLRSVELWPQPAGAPRGQLLLGEFLLGGRVVLYAQPRAPWIIGSLLGAQEERRLQRAGARLSVDHRGCLTIVEWPAHSLRDLMLRDVLPHELAHHAQQVRHHKMDVAALRAGDHDAVAYLAAPRESLMEIG